MLARAHSIVRRLRALRRDRARRDAEGVLLAEGIHLAMEAIGSGADVEMAIASPRLRRSPEGAAARRRLEEEGVEVLEVPDPTLDSLQDARSPQPLLLVVRRRPATLEEVLDGRGGPALLAVLHGLQDPGNLGSALRTADAAGATGLVATGDGVDLYHPRAVRATMGSLFRLPAAACTLEALLPRLRERGIAALGSDPAAGVEYTRSDLARPVAIVLGPEGRGLPPDLLGRLDGTVRIPMHEGVESLSVGAAAAILLFEARRQRSLSRGG